KPEGTERIYIKRSIEGEHEIDNLGLIHAIESELKSGETPFSSVVKSSGSIKTMKTVYKNGRILLQAEGGETSLAGTLTAPGGEVQILGDHVHLSESANVDVSAKESGGEIYIGGGYQGHTPNF